MESSFVFDVSHLDKEGDSPYNNLKFEIIKDDDGDNIFISKVTESRVS